MRRIPLFVQEPAVPGLEEGLMQLDHELLRVFPLLMREGLFTVLWESRPCILLLSITADTTVEATHQFLKDLKKFRSEHGGGDFDSTFRIIVITEGNETHRLNWGAVGVNELIMGAPTAHTLKFKLTHHYHRAIADLPLQTSHPSESKKPSNYFQHRQWKSHFQHKEDEHKDQKSEPVDSIAPSSRNTVIAPDKKPQELDHTHTADEITVKVHLPGVHPSRGSWKSHPSDDPESKWNWHPPETYDHPTAKPNPGSKLQYTGNEPKFDPHDQSWELTGQSPKLVHFKDDLDPGASILECIVGPRGGLTLRVKEGVDVRSAQKTTYFLKDHLKLKPKATPAVETKDPGRVLRQSEVSAPAMQPSAARAVPLVDLKSTAVPLVSVQSAKPAAETRESVDRLAKAPASEKSPIPDVIAKTLGIPQEKGAPKPKLDEQATRDALESRTDDTPGRQINVHDVTSKTTSTTLRSVGSVIPNPHHHREHEAQEPLPELKKTSPTTMPAAGGKRPQEGEPTLPETQVTGTGESDIHHEESPSSKTAIPQDSVMYSNADQKPQHRTELAGAPPPPSQVEEVSGDAKTAILYEEQPTVIGKSVDSSWSVIYHDHLEPRAPDADLHKPLVEDESLDEEESVTIGTSTAKPSKPETPDLETGTWVRRILKTIRSFLKV